MILAVAQPRPAIDDPHQWPQQHQPAHGGATIPRRVRNTAAREQQGRQAQP